MGIHHSKKSGSFQRGFSPWECYSLVDFVNRKTPHQSTAANREKVRAYLSPSLLGLFPGSNLLPALALHSVEAPRGFPQLALYGHIRQNVGAVLHPLPCMAP